MEFIHIYHTNDLHSHFENWPRIVELIRERKIWHEEEGDTVFLFDIGDHLDLSHPYTEASQGKINTKLLEKEHFTAVTIGNNEGITLNYEALDHLYDNTSFDVIISNLYKRSGERPSWAIPHTIYETNKGTKIGVFGLTAYFDHLYHLLGWNISDPFDELQKQLVQLRDQVDIIILLSHLGINEDEQIAARFPEIDVILGAHTHHILHTGKELNNSLLGAAGKFGHYVGHIMLSVDPVSKSILDKKAELYDTNKLPVAKGEKDIIEQLFYQGKQALSEEVVCLDTPLSKQNLARLLSEVLMDWCKADCSILNEGLILEDLPKGSVTYFDLLTICPHPINPCTVILTGSELKEILVEMQSEKWECLPLKGLGFRGTLMGKMIASGIQEDRTEAVTSYYIKEEILDSKKDYVVAIPDMFTFGNFFPSIYRATDKNYYLPEFLRNILADKLKGMATYS